MTNLSFYTFAADRRACLVLPGLFAAEAAGLQSLHTPYLCRLLSRAGFFEAPGASLESVVMNWFHSGDSVSSNSAAILGYQLDFKQIPDTSYVLRVDPVYQQMDINHAVLADQSVLDLELDEAQALVDTINQHFAADGIKIEIASPLRWYCHFPEALDVVTNPPGKAVGRDVAAESPAGPDASKWRSTLAEIEMLLYAHPVNMQRQGIGKVAVNSLWLWGEGTVPSLSKAPLGNPVADPTARDTVVFTENFYTQSLANHGATPVTTLSELASLKLQDQAILVVDDRLLQAAATADEALRNRVVQQLDDQLFKPMWEKLGRRGLRSVQIWAGGNQWLQVDWQARYKFWCRSKPLGDFINYGAAVDDVD